MLICLCEVCNFMAYFDKLTGNKVYRGTRSWLNASASLTRCLMSPVFVSNICFISISSVWMWYCCNVDLWSISLYYATISSVLWLLFNTAMYTIEIKKDMNTDCFFTFGIILKIVFLYDFLPRFLWLRNYV